ncbi:MAG: YebC/PmpR family DNA-binding transcriptional regulator [Candidatus Onthovivens sp.]|nr:YebC/PmpR family DNA-binding transcriptional regulator [Mollicutes bacterium]MDY4857335.1 YebC/PmpR family DNA-binding transcriptional regulator [Candidatus Onthovivens sp.]MDY4936868.1 YebC/PmpR family DNA-binding transcriptional regulator [Candidatus Onthovivens sp.]
MGRHFEVRAAAMAATAKQKSAVYMRASKEIYMAAKRGVPDPNSNLALRAAIDKYRKSCPKDVIERAIKKAQGGDAENYIEGRYEAYGPGNSYLIIDTLTDNTNRALVNVRTCVTRKGGHLGSVLYNFTLNGLFVFDTNKTAEELEETLILNDVDVLDVSVEDGKAEVLVTDEAFENAKKVLNDDGINDFDVAEVRFIPNEKITLEGEDLKKFNDLLDSLDDCEDVQAVYHNVER